MTVRGAEARPGQSVFGRDIKRIEEISERWANNCCPDCGCYATAAYEDVRFLMRVLRRFQDAVEPLSGGRP